MGMHDTTIATITPELATPIVIDMVDVIMAYLMLMDVTSIMDTIVIQETMVIMVQLHFNSGSFENTTSL